MIYRFLICINFIVGLHILTLNNLISLSLNEVLIISRVLKYSMKMDFEKRKMESFLSILVCNKHCMVMRVFEGDECECMS